MKKIKAEEYSKWNKNLYKEDKELTPLEALENIKSDLEYITRLDYVEPIVRGEVRDKLYKIYHRELPELDIIETELKRLEKQDKKIKGMELALSEHALTIQRQHDQIEKQDEILRIIKEHIYIKGNRVYYKNYEWVLTPMQFDLLKEMLL